MMLSWMEKIPDQVGFLVLSAADGGVMSSGGELENEERIGEIIRKMVYCADRRDLLPTDNSDAINRMSIYLGKYYYVVTLSSQKIFISKREYLPVEPVVV
ncbi:ragulator complex protein LAMTOR4 [Dermacentor andersoni]|uniref:ragulator complex protein LAMTOR4 n=1 Tax=Dermacentor andersoni TaxID=34620 RepID=UPI0021552492|nr:ragulator complex protein LAMTOR4-like [Dermacentor andersoni]